MAGSEPIWLVDGSFGRWPAEDRLEESVWVLSRPISGQLVVTGRRLRDHLPMRFVDSDSTNGARAERLVIGDPAERSVVPGGSTPEIIDQYAFVTTYLIYPRPGCWEITARLGEHERRIVVEVTEQNQEIGSGTERSRHEH